MFNNPRVWITNSTKYALKIYVETIKYWKTYLYSGKKQEKVDTEMRKFGKNHKSKSIHQNGNKLNDVIRNFSQPNNNNQNIHHIINELTNWKCHKLLLRYSSS